MKEESAIVLSKGKKFDLNSRYKNVENYLNIGDFLIPNKGEIARELCLKYPKTPNLTLARMLYGSNKPLFNGIDAARCCIRRVRGVAGSQHRKYYSKTSLPSPSTISPFESLPPALTHFDNWQSYQLQGNMRVALLSDLHIPYHDRVAVQVALEHILAYKPSHIILNGDIADFFSVSFWEKDPRKRNFSLEIASVKQFLKIVRNVFPEAIILYKEGNHEERYARYLAVKAPELLGIQALEFSKILCLDDYKITLIGDKRPILLGKRLHVIHGHEIRWGITSPVNPARGFYMRGKECCIGGHLHQSSSHSEKSMSESIVSCWSTGCLCDMHPDYSPLNKWNLGFAEVTVENSGSFEVENYKIINNRVYRD